MTDKDLKKEMMNDLGSYKRIYLLFSSFILIVQCLTIYLSIINLFTKIFIVVVSEIVILISLFILITEQNNTHDLQDFVTYYALNKVKEKEDDKQKRQN